MRQQQDDAPQWIPVAQLLRATGIEFAPVRMDVCMSGLPMRISPEHLTAPRWTAANDAPTPRDAA